MRINVFIKFRTRLITQNSDNVTTITPHITSLSCFRQVIMNFRRNTSVKNIFIRTKLYRMPFHVIIYDSPKRLKPSCRLIFQCVKTDRRASLGNLSWWSGRVCSAAAVYISVPLKATNDDHQRCRPRLSKVHWIAEHDHIGWWAGHAEGCNFERKLWAINFVTIKLAKLDLCMACI